MELSNEQLAEQLRKLKIEQHHKQNIIDSIIATDPEIKTMRKKIDASYVSKERARQMADNQSRILEDKISQAEQEALMLAEGQKQAARKEAERRALLEAEKDNRRVIESQIGSRKEIEREARTEYLKEKAIVDREMQQLRED